MNRTTKLTVASFSVFAALLAAFVSHQMLSASPEAGQPTAVLGAAPSTAATARDKQRSKRLFDMVMTSPNRDYRELEMLAADSDHLTAAVDDETDKDVGQTIRAQLRAVQVTEAEARSYFEANRQIFGNRSFLESRDAIERLIAIERVQQNIEHQRRPL